MLYNLTGKCGILVRPKNVQKESPSFSFKVFLITMKEEFQVTSNFVTIY